MAERQEHWDGVYSARSEDELTWFEASPSISLELITKYLPPGQAMIDIGAGASRLVDVLLDLGFHQLAVLDLSHSALEISRQRLAVRGEGVDWIEADVTTWQPDREYAVWHDRAVFHFLTEKEGRKAYADAMSKSLRPDGIAIIATFADDGPEKCSGLPVVRYTPEELAKELDRLAPGQFERVSSQRHVHITPKGNRQSFQYSAFRKKGL
jgi:SAM-dependent methyltransferase